MNLLYILLAILFFGVLIFIHELGHFIVARLCGVKILEFAIGMGPRIFSVKSKKSGISYSLRLFPIGGFVSMLGEGGMELAQGNNGMSGEPENNGSGNANGEKTDSDSTFFFNTEEEESQEQKPEEPVPMDPELAKHAYCNQSIWKRILISLAGPAMNIILGFVLMLVLVLCLGQDSALSNQIGGFVVQYSAEQADQGFQKGDQIYSVDGERIRSFAQLKEMVTAKEEGATFEILLLRLNEDQTKTLEITLSDVVLTLEFLEQGFHYSLSEQHGLQINDTVIKVNGTSVHTYNELSYEIMNQGYKPMKLTVLRNGEKVVLENVIVPSYVDSGVTFGDIDFLVYREDSFNFPVIAKHAFWRSCSTVKMVFDSLGGLFSGRYGVEAVSGPIGITSVITTAAKTSIWQVLNLLILISINLGIMNLLPLPALDGGHILIYIIEAIRRKPLKPGVEAMINFIGLFLLLALAVIISIKDVIAL